MHKKIHIPLSKVLPVAILASFLGAGIFLTSLTENSKEYMRMQFAAVSKADSCIPKAEYEKAKASINDLDTDLMDQYIVLGKLKNRIKELQDNATVVLDNIAKLELATTTANTTDLEKKLELKTKEIETLKSLLTQRTEINLQESNLPKNRSDLQKKEAEKVTLSNEITVLNKRISALENISATKTKLDAEDIKVKAILQELNDRRTLDAYVSTQSNLNAQIKHWQLFKNNAAAVKNVTTLQAQFDKNKAAQDVLIKKYTNAQGVLSLRSAFVLQTEYNKVLQQKNVFQNAYTNALSQYNRTYTKDSNLTKEQIVIRLDAAKKSLQELETAIRDLENTIDFVTKNIPALKTKFVADVKIYYRDFYNKNETNTIYAAVKLPDIKPIELESAKLSEQIDQEKQKVAQVATDLKYKKTELAQLITRIDLTTDALKIAEDRKNELAKKTVETKKSIENVEVCIIEKNIVNTTSDGNGTTTPPVGFIAPQAVSNNIAQIVSVTPAPGSQVAPEDAALNVYFDRPVTINGIFGANFASGPLQVSGNNLTVGVDNPQPGEVTVSYTVGLDTIDDEGSVVSGQYSYSTSYFITANAQDNNSGGSNSNQQQNRPGNQGNGLEGDVCCMCIYGDMVEGSGDRKLKKSCDEQFGENKCDFFKRTKRYAQTASDVAEAVNDFPDVCPATKYKNVHLFYELHGQKDGEEAELCRDLPVLILKEYTEAQEGVPENIGVTHGKCNAFNNLAQADSAAKQLSGILADAGLVNVKVTVTGNQNNSGIDGKGRDSGVCAGEATYEVCSSYSERTLSECPAVGSFCLPSNDSNPSIKCMENNKVKTMTCVQLGASENGLIYGEYR